MELAANICPRTGANVTHFSAEESLAASLCPSPLEQKPLTPCFLVKCCGALHPANAFPLPGDLPFEVAALKQAAVAGAAFTPTLPVNGRFSWVWNNSLSAAVDRKCNISIPWRGLCGWSNYCENEWRNRENKRTVNPSESVGFSRSSNGFPRRDTTYLSRSTSTPLCTRLVKRAVSHRDRSSLLLWAYIYSSNVFKDTFPL